MHTYRDNAECIAKAISSRKGVLKIVLKTLDDPILLKRWIEHHASIVGIHNIIIADNGSIDPVVLKVYDEYADDLIVFQFDGFHNFIHNQSRYPLLYSSLSASSDYFLFLDTDEFLVQIRGDECIYGPSIVDEISKQQEKIAIPTVWLFNAPLSDKIFNLGSDEQTLRTNLKWGKPIVPSSLSVDGGPIHNIQFPARIYGEGARFCFFLLHVVNLSVEQRLRTCKNKLVARGFVSKDASYEEIIAKFHPPFTDPNIDHYVREISRLLNQGGRSSPDYSSIPERNIMINWNGLISYPDDVHRGRLHNFIKNSHFIISETLCIGTLDVTDIPRHDPQALKQAAMSHVHCGKRREAEATMRTGMELYPTELDQYGHPTFRKELIRLFLAYGEQARAMELVPTKGAAGGEHWHEVLFARAYTAQGDKESAISWWAKALKSDPHNSEAISALTKLKDKVRVIPMAPTFEESSETLRNEVERLLEQSQLRGRFSTMFQFAGITDDVIHDFVRSKLSVFQDTINASTLLNERISRKIHRVWITKATGEYMPPEEYLEDIAAQVRNLGDSFSTIFWTNSAPARDAFAIYFEERSAPLKVCLISELAFNEKLDLFIDKLIAEKKYVLAADIIKIVILYSHGGIYADLGVQFQSPLAEMVIRSDISLILDPQLFFQLSFLAAPKESKLLEFWAWLLCQPETLTALLLPGASHFGSVDEVDILAGPGFTVCVLLLAGLIDQVLIAPCFGSLLQWRSQQSWYPGKAKYGNVPVQETPPTLMNFNLHESIMSSTSNQMIVVGSNQKDAAIVQLALGAKKFFEDNPTELCVKMNAAGSDKAKGWHDYAFIYHHLLHDNVGKNPWILEIGIGTNFTDVPSSMGPHGVPGASLRAWRDYFKTDKVFGADVDRRILFEETGIKTFFVDQTDRNTLMALAEALSGSPLDLIIDDGLHTYDANINTFDCLFPLLRSGGSYIIEDVFLVLIPKWEKFLSSRGIDALIVKPENKINRNDNCFIFIRKK